MYYSKRRKAVKKKNAFRLTVLVIGTLLLMFFYVSCWATDIKHESHPELNEQEMFIACADCHKETTPDIEKEWFDSVHGIAMVKCYQCHGTFETFRVNPGKANCATCHADQLDKSIAKDKQCWECHVPHSFKTEK